MVTAREGSEGFVVVDSMLKHSARVTPSIAFREFFFLMLGGGQFLPGYGVALNGSCLFSSCFTSGY